MHGAGQSLAVDGPARGSLCVREQAPILGKPVLWICCVSTQIGSLSLISISVTGNILDGSKRVPVPL